MSDPHAHGPDGRRRSAHAAVGDPLAFQRLTDPHRGELQVHCYRLVGSLHDAEDLVQETMLAAWTGVERFEGRASLRAWLYRIATNRCLNALRDEGRRPAILDPPFDTPPPTSLGEATWLEPYPDSLLDEIRDLGPAPHVRYEMRESIELAFVIALQLLPPRQRAVVVLRDVLGFHAAEVARILETSEESVKGALKRARQAINRYRPDGTAPAANSAEERDLVRRFADAFEAADIDSVIALLTSDAWITMPPSPLQYQGPEAIGQFLTLAGQWPAPQRHHLIPTRANGQPAFGCYIVDPTTGVGNAAGLIVLTLRHRRIAAITRFLDNSTTAQFGLPPVTRDP